MPRLRINLILSILIFLGLDVRASTIPNIAKQQKIGAGFDINNQSFRSPCLEGDVEYTGTQSSTLNLDYTVDEETVESQLRSSISGKVNLFVASAKASLEISKFLTKSDYSQNLIYSHRIVGKTASIRNIRLTGDGLKASESNDENYKRLKCGQEFINQINLGASLYIAVRLNFESKEMKERWKAKVKFKVLGFKKTKSFRGSSGYENSSTSVSFHAVQIGGDPSRLNKVLASINRTNCTLKEIEQCHDAVDKLLDYATSEDGFRSQLNQLEYSHTDYYPAISYETIPYNQTEFKNLSTAAFSPFSVHVRNVQENISNDYSDMSELYQRSVYLLNSNRLLPEERSLFKKIRSDTRENITRLLRVRDTCLKKSEQICLAENFNLNLITIDRDKLFIPERLLDRCERAALDDPSDSDAIIIKHIYDNYPIDSCIELERKRDLITRVKIVDSNLISISILKFLPNIESLSLQNNMIGIIGPIRYLTRLRFLNISSNSVNDLNSLRFRTKLKRLNISSNSIDTLRPIRDLPLDRLYTYGNPITDYSVIERNRTRYTHLILTSEQACNDELRQSVALGLISNGDRDFYVSMGFGPTYVDPSDRRLGIEGFFYCDIASTTYRYMWDL
ncbi:leucine-rich repeat domain-containing protein [Pseudobacteriovorax antillogorgiicola]|uniref:Leucine Rich repeat-containing protein n=1 Tax=Pseudobacteriovorax antillogorgiicola TaxID=1513793 RepID=A0A1Y6C511_9BACT|nr:leucine-rich repeat domain-containing protein [Pseudobacteriovorax antillogorgiicola]TCS50349.1 hypothetical protein EDD56_113168 [Pseudobacteriovorax antillogorgiicola]SMF34837.1 hypothetical protein SAMN06296036_110167 [Pseudobacteriovorax antillogorgiicola]